MKSLQWKQQKRKNVFIYMTMLYVLQWYITKPLSVSYRIKIISMLHINNLIWKKKLLQKVDETGSDSSDSQNSFVMGSISCYWLHTQWWLTSYTVVSMKLVLLTYAQWWPWSISCYWLHTQWWQWSISCYWHDTQWWLKHFLLMTWHSVTEAFFVTDFTHSGDCEAFPVADFTHSSDWSIFCYWLHTVVTEAFSVTDFTHCGDHVADLKNPKQNKKNAGFTPEERESFGKLLDSGFIDTFRTLYPDKEEVYTFWSNFRQAREKNIGWWVTFSFYIFLYRFTHWVDGFPLSHTERGQDRE